MRTRDQGLGRWLHTGVWLYEVGAESIFLLALPFFNQYHANHKAGFILTGENLLHYAQFLLGFHILPDPLPLLKTVANGPLSDRGVILDSETKLKLVYTANGVPKNKALFQRQ